MNESTELRHQPNGGTQALLTLVRFVLPALIVLSGILLAAIGQRESAYLAGALLVSAGVSVALLNLLYRVGVRGDKDRGREEQAREHFDRTGDYWWSGYYGTTFFVSPTTGLVGVVLSQNQPGPYSPTPYVVYLAQALAFLGL